MAKKVVRIRRHLFVIQNMDTGHYVFVVRFNKKGVTVKYIENVELAARGTQVQADRVAKLLDGRFKLIQIRETE